MIVGQHTKQPAETYKLGVEFSRRLQTGETLSTPTVTAKKVSDGSDSTAALISQVAVNGTKVEARVSAGVTGEDHVLQFRTTTSLANTIEDEVLLMIRETA